MAPRRLSIRTVKQSSYETVAGRQAGEAGVEAGGMVDAAEVTRQRRRR